LVRDLYEAIKEVSLLG
jgi:hypothetical protein